MYATLISAVLNFVQASAPVTKDIPSQEYIAKASMIYGRYSSVKLTKYQEHMNEMAKSLCMENPDLMISRALLIQKSREKLHDSGYSYKKGKSRSKAFETSSSEGGVPKRPKISEEMRTSRINELEDQIKDLTDTLSYKEKRREKASNVHNYKECDELTQQISQVKSERRLLEKELEQLKKKSQRSHSYKQKKKRFLPSKSNESSSDSRSSTPLFSPTSGSAHSTISTDSQLKTPDPVSPSSLNPTSALSPSEDVIPQSNPQLETGPPPDIPQPPLIVSPTPTSSSTTDTVLLSSDSDGTDDIQPFQ